MSKNNNVAKLLQKRAIDSQKNCQRQAKKSRIANLTPAEAQRRQAGIDKRADRRATDAAERKAEAERLREEYAESVAELRRKREEEIARKQKEAAAVLEAAIKRSAEQNSGQNPAVRTQPKYGSQNVAPGMEEILTAAEFACVPKPLPDLQMLTALTSTNVLYADSEGVGVWGPGAGAWATPAGWSELIEQFNQAYLGDDSILEKFNSTVINGEYNAVFVPDHTGESAIPLPPLVDALGRTIERSEVAVRVTRPDSAIIPKTGGTFHRYKSLQNITRELYYTLHGAVNGYAPEIYAAVLFPAVVKTNSKNKRQQLYGSLYIMRRVHSDLNAIMQAKVDSLKTKCSDNSSSTHPTHPTHPTHQLEALRSVGRKVALKVLPVMVKQSKLGVLSFDSKPSNYMFGFDAKVKAIDFDAAMYSLMKVPGYEFEPNLLMNLMLITAHVRCYRHPAIADGWAAALRPLLLELCTHSRNARWLFDARITPRSFKELHDDTPDAAQQRLEMFVHAYFVSPSANESVCTPFRPDASAMAPPLVQQLVRFCLHGTTRKADANVNRAFGLQRREVPPHTS